MSPRTHSCVATKQRLEAGLFDSRTMCFLFKRPVVPSGYLVPPGGLTERGREAHTPLSQASLRSWGSRLRQK